MKMNGGMLLGAVTVVIGGFLQGWVYILLFGFPDFMKGEFNMETELVRDELVWFLVMIGMLLAMGSGRIGRRPLLVILSMLYLCCSVVMLWSSNPSLILLSRNVYGFAWGFSNVLVACYLTDNAPLGFLLYLLPHFAAFCGMSLWFIYAGMPLVHFPRWRLIFDVAFVLSLLNFIMVVYCLPESPKWLVSKGRIDEARQVLKKLCCRKVVSDELVWQLLRLGGGSFMEDCNDEELEDGPQDLSSSDNLSKPVNTSTLSQQGISHIQNITLVDSLLTLSGNGNVGEDSLTRGGEDSTSDVDASVLTIEVTTN